LVIFILQDHQWPQYFHISEQNHINVLPYAAFPLYKKPATEAAKLSAMPIIL